MSATASHPLYVSEAKRLDWSRAIAAGLVATVVITVSMALFGMNIMKSLGTMMLPGASTTVQYIAGGVFHFAVGLFWGVLYAWLFAKLAEWGPFLKGTVYGLAITAIALAVMPLMATIMPGGGSGAANPCNPCASKAAAANPCNPCASKAVAANPCNPCASKVAAGNPCNPCASKAATNPCNPCAAKAAANPCAPKNACSTAMSANPCNPCGGASQNPFSGAISAVNHLLFGLTLAFIYRRRPAA